MLPSNEVASAPELMLFSDSSSNIFIRVLKFNNTAFNASARQLHLVSLVVCLPNKQIQRLHFVWMKLPQSYKETAEYQMCSSHMTPVSINPLNIS